MTRGNTHWRLSTTRLINACLGFIGAIGLTASFAAHAASIGEAEVRSWLGEPLNVRIPIATSASEEAILDATCLKVSSDSEPFSLVRELRVTLAGAERNQFFSLGGYANVNEPYIKLVVRFQCANANAGAISRQYFLLLDPRPAVNPPATISTTPTNNVEPPQSKQSVQRLSNQWVTPLATEGARVDSLASIAEGIYPKSIKRKARYIAALRALNPDLAGLNDTATLPPNIALTLPDLRALATTRKVIAASPINTTAIVSQPKSTPQQQASQKKRPTLSIRATELAPAAPKLAAKPTPNLASKTSTVSATFSLKLSGGEIDTSRSANVTDEQRAILREKQFLLDADDQIAQFLALKNSVKQLENRLNQVQSKLDMVPASPTADASTAVGINASTAAAQVQTTKPAVSPATTLQPPIAATEKSNRSMGVWIGVLVVLSILVVSIALWLSQRKTKRIAKDAAAEAEVNSLIALEEAKIDSPDQLSTETKMQSVATTVVAPEVAAQNEADDIALALRRSKGAVVPAASLPRTPEIKSSFNPSATLILNPPSAPSLASTNDNNNAINFDLDNSPVETVDFLIGDDDGINIVDLDSASSSERKHLDDRSQQAQTDEARVLRLQYMSERYPELMSNTVSINDPDSVINAAQHYLGESDNENKGAAKAIELLIYALEERPQEIHYWLALFEVYRFKSMGDEYTALANKFSILFGESVEWRHVRQIGHELAPNNSLFQSPPAQMSNTKFDSSVWLTMDAEKNKRSNLLAAKLRTQLFADSQDAKK